MSSPSPQPVTIRPMCPKLGPFSTIACILDSPDHGHKIKVRILDHRFGSVDGNSSRDTCSRFLSHSLFSLQIRDCAHCIKWLNQTFEIAFSFKFSEVTFQREGK